MTTIDPGQSPFRAGAGIDIVNRVISVLLREENNLIMVNNDNELYTDLQLVAGIAPSDDFPVGVTVGKILESDGWEQSGMLLNWKTTSGDYARWIYGVDGEIYFDGGTGEWKQVYYAEEVDDLFQQLRDELHPVAFSGDYYDLENKPVVISDTAPTNPVEGMLWYDTTNDALKNYNGTGWIIIPTKPYVDSKVSDAQYGNDWNGDGNTAPSKNAVYDKINSIDELIPNEATSSNQLADKNYVNNKISDTAYGNNWDGETDTAPSKNAVYDKINSIDGLIPSEASTTNQLADKNYVDNKVSNTAYGNSWDGEDTTAPSQNAVYDKISDMDNTIAGKQDTLVSGTNIKTINNTSILGSGNIDTNQVSDNAYSNSWDGVTDTAPSKNAVFDKINSIDGLIPNEATSSNQLADKNYVNDSINSVTAYYITKNAQGDAFATYAELSSATTFYSGGVARTPTRNDYCIVLADENHSNAVTRYSYQGTQWEYQYTVNESPMTQAQLDALNSGITANKVTQYDTTVNTIAGYGNVVTHNTSEFATSTQGAKADTAIQPLDNISELTNNVGFITSASLPTKLSDLINDTGFITGITSTDVVNALGYTPYNANNPNGFITGITSNDVTTALGYTPYNSINPSGYVTASIINDTAYGSGWDGDTTHAPTKNAVYDKISAMDTTISGKQDALTPQTAYTSKGTASKVPQITTNTLGQVTGITEVNISYPSQVSDTAYASTWNGVTATAPSQNAVYDKINTMDTTISGKQAQHTQLSLTLTSGGWSSNTQTITATGVTASNTVFVSPAPASFDDYTSAVIYCSAQGSNSLTFTCTNTPTSNITVNVMVLN